MSRLTLLAAPTAVTLLHLLGPGPEAALGTLAGAGGATDPQPVLVAALDLAAWALVSWLILVLLVVAAGRLPGMLGAAFSGAARCLAPASVRQLAQLALGLGATALLLTADPALAAAEGPTPRPPASASPFDWPAASSDVSPTPTAQRPDGVVSHVVAHVVVHPGDTLWGIAQRQLGADAPSAAVSHSWPRWWAANRSAVGGDPDLIHPGLVLTPPMGPDLS